MHTDARPSLSIYSYRVYNLISVLFIQIQRRPFPS